MQVSRFASAGVGLAAMALIGATAQPAAAEDTLTRRAADLVASVTSGDPLRVVVTTISPNGAPQFRTTTASTRSAARSLVRTALGAGQRVSMAQRVHTTASNDTYRRQQWALDALRAESVWAFSKGGTAKQSKKTRATKRVTVAVVDTGVATDHPDLAGNIVAGYDVIDPKTAPYDENGHGTHVAGIIAAVANNKRGVAGLAPQAAIMPVRVLDRSGSGATDDVARGVTWAADRGAKVINLSLSGSQSDAALQQAVAYAQKKGAVVVAAAGNEGTRTQCALLILNCGPAVQYPAAYPGVIGVGSIDSSRGRSSFSSVGSWVDVAAPGGSILSTVPRTNRIGCGTSTYCTISGTSMAAPYVSATAALARANPSWTASRTAAYIESSATDLGPKGRDTQFGAGLVNPYAVAKAAVGR